MRPRLFCKDHRLGMTVQPARAPHGRPGEPAARLTLNTSTWSSRDTNTSVFGANSWSGGPGAEGDSAPEPPSSASSSRAAASRAHGPSCGQKLSAGVQARPQAQWGGGRGPGDADGPGLLGSTASAGWGHQEQTQTRRDMRGGGRPQPGAGPRADLRGLHRLPEGQAGAVVPLGVDVSEDSDEEGGGVPLRTQLPPTGLAELGGRAGQRAAPWAPSP